VLANLTNILTKKFYLLQTLTSTQTSNDLKTSLISSELLSILKSKTASEPSKLLDKLNPILTTSHTEEVYSDNSAKKNPYKSLRRGITNMIRIQADKAVAMPTDTRLQILAVSKDIIHSWSIPSAGIKIDCIPGYSSHRVVVFSLSGIY
jgi:heme/copper-type cytochrome/quinol oxidase subunit 2